MPESMRVGAIAQGFNLPVAFAAFAVALAAASAGMAVFAPSGGGARAAGQV